MDYPISNSENTIKTRNESISQCKSISCMKNVENEIGIDTQSIVQTYRYKVKTFCFPRFSMPENNYNRQVILLNFKSNRDLQRRNKKDDFKHQSSKNDRDKKRVNSIIVQFTKKEEKGHSQDLNKRFFIKTGNKIRRNSNLNPIYNNEEIKVIKNYTSLNVPEQRKFNSFQKNLTNLNNFYEKSKTSTIVSSNMKSDRNLITSNNKNNIEKYKNYNKSVFNCYRDRMHLNKLNQYKEDKQMINKSKKIISFNKMNKNNSTKGIEFRKIKAKEIDDADLLKAYSMPYYIRLRSKNNEDIHLKCKLIENERKFFVLHHESIPTEKVNLI